MKMDDDLKHICTELGLSSKKNHRLIEDEYGVHNLDDLLRLESRLENGELGSMVEDIKQKLLVAAAWRRKNPEVVVSEHFCSDVWDDWVESCEGNEVSMDAEMNKICEAIGMTKISRSRLLKLGITSVETLHSAVEERASRLALGGLRKHVVEDLMIASKWLRNNPTFNVLEQFDEKLFEGICEDYTFAKDYIQGCLGSPFDKDNSDEYSHVDSTPKLLDKVKEVLIDKVMTPKLKEKCGRFDFEQFLTKACERFHDAVGLRDHNERIFLYQAPTQSGKSGVKGVTLCMGGVLKVPVIVLTKGVDESIDLSEKLIDLLDGTLVKREHIVVASQRKDKYKMTNTEKRAKIERVFPANNEDQSGVLVIADTQAQVLNSALRSLERYRKKNPGGKFILIVDEVDAMYRTKERTQKFEQAMDKLLGMKPTMTVMISATPAAFMVEMIAADVWEADIEFMNFSSNYFGVKDMKPLLGDDEKEVYIQQDDLTPIGQTFDDVRIPYANEKVKALYDEAMKHEKGVLLLDVSSPRVHAENNIRQKAKAVQALYLKKDILLIAITIDGTGIHVLLPQGLQAMGEIPDLPEGSKTADDWQFSLTSSKLQKWRNNLIGDVLNCFDAAFGLYARIAVFGYTKMCRGISFRSDKRVPTHMLLRLGSGHNISTLIQTLGRATGNNRDILNANGVDCVTVLTTSADLTVCNKVQNYLNEVSHRIDQGGTLRQAMTGANEKIPDDANFFRHTTRQIGLIKGRRKLIEDQDAFVKEVKWGPPEENTKEMYWEDTHAQQLMRSIVRLHKTHPYFEPGDVEDDLKDCAECSMTKAAIRKLLGKFVDDSLVKKTRNDVSGASQYQYEIAQSLNWLCKFMNPNEGEIPSEEDLQSFSEEESAASNLESDDFFSSDEDIPIAEVIDSDEDQSNQSPNPVSDGDKRSSVSSSAPIYPGRDGTAAAAISPEKLGGDLVAKRKAPAVSESETSKKSKKEETAYSEEGKDSLEEFLNSEEAKKDVEDWVLPV